MVFLSRPVANLPTEWLEAAVVQFREWRATRPPTAPTQRDPQRRCVGPVIDGSSALTYGVMTRQRFERVDEEAAQDHA